MRVIFMGTPDFAVPILDGLAAAGHRIVLVVTQPDKARGRGRKVTYSPVKEWAVEHNVPTYQPERIRNPESIEAVNNIPAEVGVVAAFGQILPKEILDHPKYGCVNVHASLLPKYRGAAPIQWSILNGDEYTGVTTMQMGPGLDDGDILLQEKVKIADDDTGGSLFDKLADVGASLLVKTLEGLENGEITPIPQNDAESTHVGMIRKDMGKLDFSIDASVLERHVRGLYPWPGTYTYFEGKSLKVYRASVIGEAELTPDEKNAAIGTIVRISTEGDGSIAVRCSSGALSISALQLEGKKRMSAAAFLNGHPIETGMRLG
ncbi:MAG: methionyl-tRNA formyltransferase [Lachnospiraceae bacterium]|nr:MAG: methionyl-tRNA formyltransferase [Lachnospiraceae bacterium]